MEPKYKPGFFIVFSLFITNMLLLGWLGGKPVNDNILPAAQFCTAVYFAYFIFVIPLYGAFEYAVMLIIADLNFRASRPGVLKFMWHLLLNDPTDNELFMAWFMPHMELYTSVVDGSNKNISIIL